MPTAVLPPSLRAYARSMTDAERRLCDNGTVLCLRCGTPEVISWMMSRVRPVDLLEFKVGLHASPQTLHLLLQHGLDLQRRETLVMILSGALTSCNRPLLLSVITQCPDWWKELPELALFAESNETRRLLRVLTINRPYKYDWSSSYHQVTSITPIKGWECVLEGRHWSCRLEF